MAIGADKLYWYANTALAAYGDSSLAADSSTYADELADQGIASIATDEFISKFSVVDYFNDTIGPEAAGTDVFDSSLHVPTGVSATVFERNSDHERILAIRGTTKYDPADLWTDLVDIILYGSAKHQIQYAALTAKVDQWLEDGTLTPGFTVTGHSLGGFLATALTADLDTAVGHAYLFNAPGIGGFQVSGISKSFNDWLNDIRPERPAPDGGKITNVTALGSGTPISGLGIPVGDRIDIAIETHFVSSILHPLDFLHAHDMAKLTDALAVYDLLARIDPQIGLDDATFILEAATPDNSEMLESVVNGLAPLLGIEKTATGDIPRDDLFNKISEISLAIESPSPYDVVSLIIFSSERVAQLALDDIAVRYALKQLVPFALSGDDALFADYNANGELDLAADNGSGGTLTPAWIADRAELLLARSFVNTFDIGDNIHRSTGSSEDLVLIQPDSNPQVIRVVGPEGLLAHEATRQIVFGTDASDTINGFDAADRIYGEAGDDVITGGKGGDYLEGGAGNDTLNGEAGDDRLVGGTGDDTLQAGSGSDRLEGGAGLDTYIVSGGPLNYARIADSDGQGQVLLDGVALAGGTEIRPGEYCSADDGLTYRFSGSLQDEGTLAVGSALEIEHFHNGDLGIVLTPRGDLPSPVAGGERIYRDWPYDELSVSLTNSGGPPPHYPWGSPDDDTFIAGPNAGASFLGRGGNDHLIGGGTIEAELLGGAGDDWIENREIQLGANGFSDHLLAGESGRDVLTGSDDDEHLFGDFYSVSPGMSGSSETPQGRIDEFQIVYDPQEGPGGHTWSYAGTLWGVEDNYNDLTSNYDGPSINALESYLGFSAATRADDAYDDIVDGRGGDDFIVGGPGSDELYGGEGDDTLIGDDPAYGAYSVYIARHDELSADGHPNLLGEPGDDYIDGGPGNDRIEDIGGLGSVAIGGDGNDQIYVVLDGHPESEVGGVAIADGGDGNDLIRAEAPFGTAVVDGGAGADGITARADFIYVDGGTGSDTYDLYGMDITIRDEDPDPLNADTLILPGRGEDVAFSRDGDDLLIGIWINLFDEDRVGPDGEEWASVPVRIEDWFVDASHQIETIVLLSANDEESVWTPQDIEAAIGEDALAWSEVIAPDTASAEPIVLSESDYAPADPGAPAEEPDAPDDTGADSADSTPAPVTPLRVNIADADFSGTIAGTSGPDSISVLSLRGAVIDAGAGDDRITTGGGDDQITLGTGNDVALTAAGDDRIVVDRFEGAKRIDAGTGIDTMSIATSLAAVSASVEAGRIVLRDAHGNSLDTAGVNVFEFADALVFREGGESEDVVARLYETALTRPTDPARPKLWLDQILATSQSAGTFAGETVRANAYAAARDAIFPDGMQVEEIGIAGGQIILAGAAPAEALL